MKLVAKSPPPSRTAAITLKMSLIGSRPLIWRRVIVPARLHLGKLHKIIQVTMGWKTSHLHQFVVAGERYTDPGHDEYSMDDAERSLDQGKITIAHVASAATRFEYTYDYGDGWQHEIEIEKIEEPSPRITFPVCIGGANACPPEDCGGIGGYSEFLKKLARKDEWDPEDPDENDVLTWVGGYFDPTSFDANRINSEHLWPKKW